MNRAALPLAIAGALAACGDTTPAPVVEHGTAVDHGRALFEDPGVAGTEFNSYSCATCHEGDAPEGDIVRTGGSLRGVTKPVSFLANVRFVGEMQNVGKDVVRAKASFDLDIRHYGVGGQWAGTPAVAGVWKVDVVLLGVLAR